MPAALSSRTQQVFCTIQVGDTEVVRSRLMGAAVTASARDESYYRRNSINSPILFRTGIAYTYLYPWCRAAEVHLCSLCAWATGGWMYSLWPCETWYSLSCCCCLASSRFVCPWDECECELKTLWVLDWWLAQEFLLSLRDSKVVYYF